MRRLMYQKQVYCGLGLELVQVFFCFNMGGEFLFIVFICICIDYVFYGRLNNGFFFKDVKFFEFVNM